MKRSSLLRALFSVAISSTPFIRVVDADNPYNWTPSVSVTSNLDEPEGSGFCLDIFGFRSSIDCSRLQTHTCKQAGSDTQFEYVPEYGFLRAVNFASDCSASTGLDDRGCVTAHDGDAAANLGVPLGIAECVAGSANQTFVHTDEGELRLGDADAEDGLCLAAGEELKAANMFWARDLLLVDCDTIPAEFRTWTVKSAARVTVADGTDVPTSSPASSSAGTTSMPTVAPVATNSTTMDAPSSASECQAAKLSFTLGLGFLVGKFSFC